MFSLCYVGSNCQDGWTVYRNKCFRYFDSPKTWINSELYCQNLGGHLAIIGDESEEQVVRSLITHDHDHDLDDDSRSWVWIGLHDQNQEDVFVWVDGSPISYENWNPRQPDNVYNGYHNATENCVLIDDHKEGWNDYPCMHLDSYLCEISY